MRFCLMLALLYDYLETKGQYHVKLVTGPKFDQNKLTFEERSS